MSPFARVAQSYVSGDQSIPAGISARFVRRAGSGNSSLPQVQGLSLDTNFSAVDPSRCDDLMTLFIITYCISDQYSISKSLTGLLWRPVVVE